MYGQAPYFQLNIPQGEDHKVRTKRFSNIFNLVDMPGLPPDLEAIFGKIRQKKHFRQGFMDLIETQVTSRPFILAGPDSILKQTRSS